MNRMNITIKGLQWSKTYICLNINILTAFKNAINKSTRNIKQIILKIEN